MTKIAIPIKDNVLSEEFGNCSGYAVYDGNNQSVVTMNSGSLPALLEWGVTDVIAHHIDKSAVNYFSETKINLFVGVPINSPKILIDEYLRGTLLSDVTNVFHQTTKFSDEQ